MKLRNLLEVLVKNDGSDLYLSTNSPPSIKQHGVLHSISDKILSYEDIKAFAYEAMDEEQQADFEKTREMNLALCEENLARFRINIFQQRNSIAMVVRCIRFTIPDLRTLGVPETIKELVMSKRGLILFVGATGTGKSTSLASLIDYRNRNAAGHIITIEDPIEYVHVHKKSIINQREVGIDTETYSAALENTLRQAPDVILIGEIRNLETMDHAVAFAETGHLCLSTLHANNANQALERIINFFPDERKKQILLDLSLNLKAIISQRLISSKDGKRVAAFEILLNTPLVRDLINKSAIDEIKEVMSRSEEIGMQTFDTALFHLYKDNQITLKEALSNADSENNLRLRIQLDEGVADDTGSGLELTGKTTLDDPRFPYDSLKKE